MVRGMPPISFTDFEVCKGCMIGKNTRKSFFSSKSRANDILELVHSDICGPMSCPSLSGFLYYVIFIDDLSKKCWIYFLKAKSETFEKFKEFKAFIENQTSIQIKFLELIMGGSLNLIPLKISV